MTSSSSESHGNRGAEPEASPKAQNGNSDPDRPSIIAIVASALAAVTSTLALSFLGVAGTIVGVALSSVLTVVGRYLYSAYLRRTHERLRTAASAVQDKAAERSRQTTSPAPARSDAARTGSDDDADTDGQESTWGKLRALWNAVVQRHGPGKIIATVLGVFVLLLGILTAIEAIVGKPVADVVRNEPGSGTTVFGSSSGDSDPAPEDSEDPRSPDETSEPDPDSPEEQDPDTPDEPAPGEDDPAPGDDPPAPRDDQAPPDDEQPPNEPAPQQREQAPGDDQSNPDAP